MNQLRFVAILAALSKLAALSIVAVLVYALAYDLPPDHRVVVIDHVVDVLCDVSRK